MTSVSDFEKAMDRFLRLIAGFFKTNFSGLQSVPVFKTYYT